MMFRSFLTSVLVLLITLSTTAFAAELLKPVNRPTAEAAANHSKRFLAEELYFAKRHRIVKVDIDSLLKSDTATVTLFVDDEKIEIQRKNLREQPSMGSITWTGNVVFPDFDWSEENWPKEDLDRLRENGLSIDQVVSQIGQVRMFIVYWDIDMRTGEAHFAHERKGQGVGEAPTPDLSNMKIRRKAFASVTGEIDLSAIGRGVYRLEPLRYSPKYHLLYEIDSDKTFGILEEDSSNPGVVGEDAQRKLAYEQFQQTLPKQSAPMIKGEL